VRLYVFALAIEIIISAKMGNLKLSEVVLELK
jgi:hypothetical protein